jgi:hypothetical protein
LASTKVANTVTPSPFGPGATVTDTGNYATPAGNGSTNGTLNCP